MVFSWFGNIAALVVCLSWFGFGLWLRTLSMSLADVQVVGCGLIAVSLVLLGMIYQFYHRQGADADPVSHVGVVAGAACLSFFAALQLDWFLENFQLSTILPILQYVVVIGLAAGLFWFGRRLIGEPPDGNDSSEIRQ